MMKPALVTRIRTFPFSAWDGSVALASMMADATSAKASLAKRVRFIGALLCLVIEQWLDGKSLRRGPHRGTAPAERRKCFIEARGRLDLNQMPARRPFGRLAGYYPPWGRHF